METSDLEKTNLEAHVSLCAQRYKFLEARILTMGTNLEALDRDIKEVHVLLKTNTDRLIGWGVGLIAVLGAIAAWLITKYVIK